MMHFRSRLTLFAPFTLATLGLVAAAPAAENPNVFNFKTTIGSFKILGAKDPASGHLEFSFNGTVLVSGLEGKIATTGTVHQEYENTKFKKQVFHGRGKIIMDGKFTNVQFFGGDLAGRFAGTGIVRMYGEFDKNLETGKYWYDGGESVDWGTSGVLVTVPKMQMNKVAFPKPKVKIQGKN